MDDEARMLAAIDLIGRTGAQQFQLRFSDDAEPVVWIAVAQWRGAFEAGAATTPALAVFRLCDQVVDGGFCAHCHRPTGFSPDLDALPMADVVCWYQYDPELKTFRRGCEGS